MTTRGSRNVWSAVPGLALLLVAGPAWAQPAASAWAAPQGWFVYLVILIVLVGTLVALLLIRSALYRSEWSLADALSEDTDVTATTVNAAGQKEPLFRDDKPVTVTEMRASASRLIALMGMMAILLMFMGFGSFSLYSFAMTGTMSAQVDKVIYFLSSGMTLFAPYVVNKFASIFESLAPKH